jgi:hypothetical protein
MNGRVISIILQTICLVWFCSDIQISGAQTAEPDRGQLWSSVYVNYDLNDRIRAQAFMERHNGEDVSYKQNRIGGLLSYRMKRILKPIDQNDDEDRYNLVVGAGYQYVRTDQDDSYQQEHRIMVESTPKYVVPFGFLLQDRNRIEFRWMDGVYGFRYRNRLSADRPMKAGKVRLVPYATGELFWDRNYDAWNLNQYAFGVRLPYKRRVRADIYYMRQNCTTCTSDSLNIFGVRVNLFFRRTRK